jgi:uncharacterized phage-like protein YoqJ
VTAPEWPVVSGTGHRPQHMSASGHTWLRAEQRRIALKLKREHGTKVVISGMAIGFDLGWAHAALDMGLDLWAHVPFPQQADRWSPVLRAEWELLLRRAARVSCTADEFSVAALHQRNDHMLRDSTAVYAGWIQGKRDGGTASALRKAVKLGRPVVWSDPERRRTCAPTRDRLAELVGAPAAAH